MALLHASPAQSVSRCITATHFLIPDDPSWHPTVARESHDDGQIPACRGRCATRLRKRAPAALGAELTRSIRQGTIANYRRAPACFIRS